MRNITHSYSLVIFFFSVVSVNVFKLLVILEKIPGKVKDGPGNDLLLDGETNIEVNGECGSVLVRHLLSRVRGDCRWGEKVEEGVRLHLNTRIQIESLQEMKISQTSFVIFLGETPLFPFFPLRVFT